MRWKAGGGPKERQKAKDKGQKAKGRGPAGFSRLVAPRHQTFAFCLLPFAFCLSFSSPASAATPAVSVDATLLGEKARSGESELGDLIADAIRAATGADVALVAAGEIKEVSLGPGALTADQIADALTDSGDSVVVLSLTGAVIRQAIEIAVARYPLKQKGFLQVSGLEFTFDPSRPEGQRAAAVTVGAEPMRDGRTYRVAMSSSLAAGAHGYFRLWKPEHTGGEKGITLASALQSYLRTHPNLALRPGNRIHIQGAR